MTEVIINESNKGEYDKIIELLNVLYQNNQQTNQILLELKMYLERFSDDFEDSNEKIISYLDDLKLSTGSPK